MKQRARCLASVLLAAWSAGCASSVGVEFDPAEDFSHYETWQWLPRLEPPLGAPPRRDDPLRETVAALVERELDSRGYRRAEGDSPDFFVTLHLEVQREVKVTWETPAKQSVHSLHSGPSYEVQSQQRVVRVFETAELAIDLADGLDRQLVWRGTVNRRVRGELGTELEAEVGRILERFPPSVSGSDAAL